MRNKPAIILSVFLVTMLSIACSKKSGARSDEEKFVGSWNWVRSNGGIAFHIHTTPANTGKNIVLNIGSDGKYTIETNNILTSDGTYYFKKRKCIHGGDDKTFVHFSGDEGFMIEKLEGQHLEVSDEMSDGIGSVYTRE